MGIEQLDMLDSSADTMISLINADQKEQALTLISELRVLITEEKRKIAGDENTWYDYVCSGCSLACTASFKFVPTHVTYCMLDGGDEAQFSQVGIRVIT